jgi:hypothetical protein
VAIAASANSGSVTGTCSVGRCSLQSPRQSTGAYYYVVVAQGGGSSGCSTASRWCPQGWCQGQRSSSSSS